eukprot:gene9349-6572_t
MDAMLSRRRKERYQLHEMKPSKTNKPQTSIDDSIFRFSNLKNFLPHREGQEAETDVQLLLLVMHARAVGVIVSSYVSPLFRSLKQNNNNSHQPTDIVFFCPPTNIMKPRCQPPAPSPPEAELTCSLGEIVERATAGPPPPLRVVAGVPFPDVLQRQGRQPPPQSPPVGGGAFAATPGRGPRVFPFGRLPHSPPPAAKQEAPAAVEAAPAARRPPGPPAGLQDATETTVRVGQRAGGGGETAAGHRWSPATFQALWRGGFDRIALPTTGGPDSPAPLQKEAFLAELALLLRSTVRRHQVMGLELLVQHLLPSGGAGEAQALRLRLLQELEAEYQALRRRSGTNSEDDAEEGLGESAECIHLLSLLLSLYTSSQQPYVCVLVVTVLNLVLQHIVVRLPPGSDDEADPTATAITVGAGVYAGEEELLQCTTALGVDPLLQQQELDRLLSRQPSDAALSLLLFLRRAGRVGDLPLGYSRSSNRGRGVPPSHLLELCDQLKMTTKLLANAHVFFAEPNVEEVADGLPGHPGERGLLPSAWEREALMVQLLLACGAGVSRSSSLDLVMGSGRWFPEWVERRLSQWVLADIPQHSKVKGGGGEDEEGDEDLEGLCALVPLLLLLRRIAQHESALHHLVFPLQPSAREAQSKDDIYIPPVDGEMPSGEEEEPTAARSTMKETLELFFIRVCSLTPPSQRQEKGSSPPSPHVMAVLVALLLLRDFLGAGEETEKEAAADGAARRHRRFMLMEVVSDLMDVLLESGLQMGAGLVVEQWLRCAVRHYNPEGPFLSLPPPPLLSFFAQAASTALDGLIRSDSVAPVGCGGAWSQLLFTAHHQLLATYLDMAECYQGTCGRARTVGKGWALPGEFLSRLARVWLKAGVLQTAERAPAAALTFAQRHRFDRLHSPWIDPEAYAAFVSLPPPSPLSPSPLSHIWPVLRAVRPFFYEWEWAAAQLPQCFTSKWGEENAPDPLDPLTTNTKSAKARATDTISLESSPWTAQERRGSRERLYLALCAAAGEAQLRLLRCVLRTCGRPAGAAGSRPLISVEAQAAVVGRVSNLLTVFVDHCFGLRNQPRSRLGREELRSAATAIAVWIDHHHHHHLALPATAGATGCSGVVSLRPLHLAAVFLLQAISRGAAGCEGLLPVALQGAFCGLEGQLQPAAGAGPAPGGESSWRLLLEELQLGLELEVSPFHAKAEAEADDGGAVRLAMVGAPRRWVMAPLASFVAVCQHASETNVGSTGGADDALPPALSQRYGEVVGLWAQWVRYVFALDRRMKDVLDAASVLSHMLSLYMEIPPRTLPHAAEAALISCMTGLLCSVCPLGSSSSTAFDGSFGPAALRALTTSLSGRQQPNQEQPLHPIVYLILAVLLGHLVIHPQASEPAMTDSMLHVVYLLLHSPVLRWAEEGWQATTTQEKDFHQLLEEMRSWRGRRPWRHPTPSSAATFPTTNWCIQYVQHVAPRLRQRITQAGAGAEAQPPHHMHPLDRPAAAPQDTLQELFELAASRPAEGLPSFALQELTHAVLEAYVWSKQKSSQPAALTAVGTDGGFQLSAFESEAWRRTLDDLQCPAVTTGNCMKHFDMHPSPPNNKTPSFLLSLLPGDLHLALLAIPFPNCLLRLVCSALNSGKEKHNMPSGGLSGAYENVQVCAYPLSFLLSSFDSFPYLFDYFFCLRIVFITIFLLSEAGAPLKEVVETQREAFNALNEESPRSHWPTNSTLNSFPSNIAFGTRLIVYLFFIIIYYCCLVEGCEEAKRERKPPIPFYFFFSPPLAYLHRTHRSG